MKTIFRQGMQPFKLDFPIQTAPSGALLFISSHFDKQGYTEIQHQVLETLKPTNLVGGIIDSINGQAGWALIMLQNRCKSHYFPPGISKKNQVGRWPSSIPLPQVAKKSAFQSISQSLIHAEYKLPSDWDTKTETNFFTISDSSPHDFLRFVSDKQPNQTTAGIIGAQTPFLNGKDFTLFHNDQVHHSGTVALVTPSKFHTRVETFGLIPIGTEFTITKCQGNIVLELESQDSALPLTATSELIKSLRKRDQQVPISAKLEFNGKSLIVRVLGGDSAKGSLCLDLDADIFPGSKLQFLIMNNVDSIHAAVLNQEHWPHVGLSGIEVSSEKSLPLALESELGLVSAGSDAYANFDLLKSQGTQLQLRIE